MPTPTIETFTLGPWQTNCFLIHDAPTQACWIADVSFEPEPLIDRVRELSLQPQAIVLTHAHLDHIAGVAEFLRAFPKTPVWIHEAEAQWLSDPMLNLSAAIGMPITAPGPERLIRDRETLSLAGHDWEVRHTAGHSPGGIALVHHASKRAIVGDTLFAGSIGRHDFPGSSFDTLERSIRERLYTLPDDFTIFPGHGPATTIAREKRSNPFVRGE